MNIPKVIAYNTFVQVLAKAVTIIFGITTTVVLTSYLGPSGFGGYTFALSFVAIFSSISDWGTMLITVREAAKKEEEMEQIFGNVFLLRFGLSLVSTLSCWLIIFLFPLASGNSLLLRQLAILSSTLILIFALKSSLAIIFQTKLRMDKGALVDLTASLLTLVFSVLVVKGGGNLFFLMIAMIFANIFAVTLSFFLVRPLVSIDFSLSWSILRRITLEALPMGGILILFSIYNRIDILILQAIKGSAAVGIYGLSYRVYEVLVLGAFYLMNSLLPIISREKDKKKLCLLYQKTLDVLILAGIVVVSGTLVLAPIAIRIVTCGRFAEFLESIPLLRILSLAVFVSFLNHLTGYTIVALGKQRRYFLISMVALIFNIGLNLFLIPTFSFYAAAWVTLFTELLVFSLTSFYIARILNFVPNFLAFPKTAEELIKKRRIFFGKMT